MWTLSWPLSGCLVWPLLAFDLAVGLTFYLGFWFGHRLGLLIICFIFWLARWLGLNWAYGLVFDWAFVLASGLAFGLD